MEIIKLTEKCPAIIEPKIFKDDRGYFFESFNEDAFRELVADIELTDKNNQVSYFVQDNESKSSYGVLRGLHFQKPPYEQSKLVRVVSGAVIDVAVDIRKDSPTYKKYFYAYLSEENHRQFFIPRGFAHGFLSLRDNTVFQYKCDNFYNKESEGAIYYDDPDINIPWGEWINVNDIKLSDKDKNNRLLEEIENPF